MWLLRGRPSWTWPFLRRWTSDNLVSCWSFRTLVYIKYVPALFCQYTHKIVGTRGIETPSTQVTRLPQPVFGFFEIAFADPYSLTLRQFLVGGVVQQPPASDSGLPSTPPRLLVTDSLWVWPSALMFAYAVIPLRVWFPIFSKCVDNGRAYFSTYILFTDCHGWSFLTLH